jgi:RNA polymerase sigma factor (sigma-70 family)
MQASKDQLLVQDTEQLVLRARQHDAAAFTLLIRRYERVVLSVAFAIVGNADSAGDVAQDTFLRAWQRLGDLKEPAHFATWLCGIARNLAIDQRRRGRFVMTSIADAALDAAAVKDGGPDPLEELSRREQLAQVGAALQALDETTRPAVILRYYDGLSSKEIGEILGLSPAAVDMRLSRARQQLRVLLAPADAVREM